VVSGQQPGLPVSLTSASTAQTQLPAQQLCADTVYLHLQGGLGCGPTPVLRLLLLLLC